jgi:hypothetical protein
MPEILSELYPPLKRYCPILPHLSVPQSLLLTFQGREALYGGAVGGGKSAGLLAAALRFVDTPGYSALLLRRTFAELEDPGGGLITLSKEWFGAYNNELEWNAGKHLWTFPSGATIKFGHVQHEDNKFTYQGGGHQFVGFDELTHFTESIYLYIGFSRQRRRVELAHIPVQTFASANPGGIGHIWVNRRFITRRAREALFVPATIYDNPGLDAADYERSLHYLPETLRRQLMEGDWGAVEGAAYDYDDEVHSVPPFVIPPDWERFEMMDHGLSNPAAWYICATDYDGNLIIFDGYYAQIPPAKLISDHCSAVLDLRDFWYPEWVGPDGRPMRAHPRTIADPSVTTSLGMLSSKQGIPATIATEYHDQSNGKITLIPGNNDRAAGMARVAELLRIDPDRAFPDWHPKRGEVGSPRLFIVKMRCGELVEQVRSAPVLSLDSGHRGAGEMVDPDWEKAYGHAHAALRYGVMSRPSASSELDAPGDWNPRSDALRAYEKRMYEGEYGRPVLIDV